MKRRDRVRIMGVFSITEHEASTVLVPQPVEALLQIFLVFDAAFFDIVETGKILGQFLFRIFWWCL